MKCKWCNKIIEDILSGGFYVCKCEEAQEEYKKEVAEQSKNEILFFGFNNRDEGIKQYGKDFIEHMEQNGKKTFSDDKKTVYFKWKKYEIGY